jgi:hypothetical protein
VEPLDPPGEVVHPFAPVGERLAVLGDEVDDGHVDRPDAVAAVPGLQRWRVGLGRRRGQQGGEQREMEHRGRHGGSSLAIEIVIAARFRILMSL